MLRLGPVFSSPLVAGTLDEVSHAGGGDGAALLQSIRLPTDEAGACLFVPTAGHTSGHAAVLQLLPDSSGNGSATPEYRIACVAADGVTPMLARVSTDGTVRVSPGCPPGGGGCLPAGLAVATVERETAKHLAPVVVQVPVASSLLVGGSADDGVHMAQLLAGARVVARLPSGETLFTRVDGVFSIAPGASLAQPVLAGGFFNSSANLHPGMLHVSPNRTAMYISGKPPKTWARGSACAGGSFGLYEFRPVPGMEPGSAGSWACAARHTRLGRTFFVNGHALTGHDAAPTAAYVLHVATDSFVTRCVLPAPGAAGGSATMGCTEFMSVGDFGGASYAFRGLAVVP